MQNRSTAVMQRRSEPHDSLDDFPTPPWATRALCEQIIGLEECRDKTVWEPCCNRGYMVEPLREYFKSVYASDIHNYGYENQDELTDFLFSYNQADWIITNPPFRLADRVIEHALNQARYGVAVIVRSAFLEGKARYENIFKHNPPAIVAQFCERVPMVKGKYDPSASSATAYSWLVWNKQILSTTTELRWIEPCRNKLEKDADKDLAA